MSPCPYTLSPGRAKMSVSGPCTSKPNQPPAPSTSSSPSPSTPSTPSVSPGPHKVHRARKTMNRPPLGQMGHVDALAVSRTPSGSYLSSDSETGQ
ncbi:hypothetical protein ILYODFUR_037741 [Ilyodon furcidens]|uniref:Uncharacterized protein n=1 Tax=Ilyodon furcidens TaxID=33524 RepID=A0ABV0VA43_9TELE